jgi:metal-responsive CopG/Arc/MetJ family transcriptional regulator
MTSSTIAVATMDMTVKIGITLPKSTILKIDNKRGDIARSRYIRRAIERYIASSSSKNIDNDNDSITAAKKMRRK